MYEIRLHGRGGQGVVTAAELLATAAFADGQEALAFPSFGSERMGAPVVSFCRISDHLIRLREPINEPDVVVVIDATLLHHVDVFAGLSSTGLVLINSARTASELGLDDLVDRLPAGHVATVAASEAARAHLGKPVPNVSMLGAVAALTGAVSMTALEVAVLERFPGDVGTRNVAAAQACYEAIGVRADA